MPQYLYVRPAALGESTAAERLPEEFEGSLNQVLARRHAEESYGPGGRLFREVEPPEMYPRVYREKVQIFCREIEKAPIPHPPLSGQVRLEVDPARRVIIVGGP